MYRLALVGGGECTTRSSGLMMRHVAWWGVCRAAEGPRARELDRRAAALGRKLAKGLETNEEEEEEEEDFYDVSEMEVSGIAFSPVKRYPWHGLLSCPCLGPGVESASSWGDFWGHLASLGTLLLQNVRNRQSPMAPNRDCWEFAHSQGKGLLFARVSVAFLGGGLLKVYVHEGTCSLGFFSVQPLQTLLHMGPLCHPNPRELPGTAALGARPCSCLWPCSRSLAALLRAWASPVATYPSEASSMKAPSCFV